MYFLRLSWTLYGSSPCVACGGEGMAGRGVSHGVYTHHLGPSFALCGCSRENVKNHSTLYWYFVLLLYQSFFGLGSKHVCDISHTRGSVEPCGYFIATMMPLGGGGGGGARRSIPYKRGGKNKCDVFFPFCHHAHERQHSFYKSRRVL